MCREGAARGGTGQEKACGPRPRQSKAFSLSILARCDARVPFPELVGVRSWHRGRAARVFFFFYSPLAGNGGIERGGGRFAGHADPRLLAARPAARRGSLCTAARPRGRERSSRFSPAGVCRGGSQPAGAEVSRPFPRPSLTRSPPGGARQRGKMKFVRSGGRAPNGSLI